MSLSNHELVLRQAQDERSPSRRLRTIGELIDPSHGRHVDPDARIVANSSAMRRQVDLGRGRVGSSVPACAARSTCVIASRR